MNTKLKKWPIVFDELKRYKETSTLLGNGFSIAWDKESFSQLGLKPPCIQCLNLSDAETCIRELCMGMDSIKDENLRKTAQKIVRSKIHADFLRILCDQLPERFSGEKAWPFVKFLEISNNIFTLNYDPLVYLLINKFKKNINTTQSQMHESEEEEKEMEIISRVISNFIENSSWHIVIDGSEIIIEDSKKQKRTVVISKLIDFLNQHDEVKGFISKYVSNEKFVKKYKTWFNCKVDACLNMPVIPELSVLQFSDGFKVKGTTALWSPENDQSFYHLHGAFHIVKHNDENGDELIHKLIASGKHSMLEELNQHLDKGHLPISILEGTSEKKLQSIRNNSYMNACYEALCEQKGAIVTLGVSFAENDKHIADAIINNTYVERVYIGVFKNDDTLQELERLKNVFSTILDKITFFESNDTLK